MQSSMGCCISKEVRAKEQGTPHSISARRLVYSTDETLATISEHNGVMSMTQQGERLTIEPHLPEQCSSSACYDEPPRAFDVSIVNSKGAHCPLHHSAQNIQVIGVTMKGQLIVSCDALILRRPNTRDITWSLIYIRRLARMRGEFNECNASGMATKIKCSKLRADAVVKRALVCSHLPVSALKSFSRFVYSNQSTTNVSYSLCNCASIKLPIARYRQCIDGIGARWCILTLLLQ